MPILLNKNLLNVKNKNGKFESIDILTGPADDFLSSSSTNYVQNKVLKAEFDKKANIDEVPSIKVNNALNADTVGGHTVGIDIPTPETGTQDRFLRSDGTWVKITTTSDLGNWGQARDGITDVNNLPLGFSAVIKGTHDHSPDSFWSTVLTMGSSDNETYRQQISFPWSSTGDLKIKYRVEDNGTWTDWKDINIGGSGSGNATTLNGKSDSDFANAYNNFLVDYLSGQTGDIRALAYKLPMGNFVFNTADGGLSGITFPWSGTGLMTWIPSKNDEPLLYYGMLFIRPLTTNGITYICSVYNTTSYTDWMSTADGGNAATVNGYTVASNVPANAVFTDTKYDLSPYLLTSNLSSTLAGMNVRVNTIAATYADGLRIVYGDYGFFIRNDGSCTYFMLTNANDQYGIWNGLRPIYINNSNGVVCMGNGLAVNGGGLSVNGGGFAVANGGGAVITGWLNSHAGRSNTARDDYTTYQWRNTAASTSATPTSDATYGTAGSIYLQYS